MLTKTNLNINKQKLNDSDDHIFSIMKSIAIVLGALLFFISSTPTLASTEGQPIVECEAGANTQELIDEQTQAEVAVTERAEYNSLRKSLDTKKRLLIMSSLGYETVAESCMWRISVFVDNNSESRRVLSQMYLVTRSGQVKYMLNPEGDFVKVQEKK